jgi:hypothetical protein
LAERPAPHREAPSWRPSSWRPSAAGPSRRLVRPVRHAVDPRFDGSCQTRGTYGCRSARIPAEDLETALVSELDRSSRPR